MRLTPPKLTDDEIDAAQDECDCIGLEGSPRIHDFAHTIESALNAKWLEMLAGQEPCAWLLHIGDSDVWPYCGSELDADFYGRQSGLKYEKKPLYAAPVPAQAPMTDEQRNWAINQIMEQAQVFASAWSLVGGRFDVGDGLELAEAEKLALRAMVEAHHNIPQEPK